MEVFKGIEITKIEGCQSETVIDNVVVEFNLEIYLNCSFLVRLVCTPRDLEALVYGHLFARGIIKTLDDIESLSIADAKAQVFLKQETFPKENSPKIDFSDPLSERAAADSKDVFLSPEELFAALASLDANSPLFTATGGVHGCLLANIDGKQLFTEDLGRHNAIDKVLGRALMAGWDLTGAYLVTGARIAESLLGKALNSGLPLIVSRSAPTVEAVKMARKYNLTLCGFARGRRMNIYSGLQRIKNI